MKKFACVVLAAMLFVFSVPSLAQVDFTALEQANILSVIAETYPAFMHRVFYYDTETGEVARSIDCYVSNDERAGVRYIYVLPNGDIEVWGDGTCFGYASYAQTLYVCGFAGDAYEEQMRFHNGQNQGDFFEGLSVVSEEKSASGKLLITVEGPIPEGEKDLEQFAGLPDAAYYTVDPETLIIEAGDTVIRGEDGVEKPFATFTTEIGPTYTLPFDVAPIERPQAMREAHVIMDPGTDEEIDCVLLAPLDIPMIIYTPHMCDLYDDAACTIPSVDITKDANGNYPEISTSYCRTTE